MSTSSVRRWNQDHPQKIHEPIAYGGSSEGLPSRSWWVEPRTYQEFSAMAKHESSRMNCSRMAKGKYLTTELDQ